VANRRNDFTHRLSSRIAKTHGAICIEDLAVKNLVKNHHLARSINDAAWGELGSQLRLQGGVVRGHLGGGPALFRLHQDLLVVRVGQPKDDAGGSALYLSAL
jgi:IS605 OrfB family transposase